MALGRQSARRAGLGLLLLGLAVPACRRAPGAGEPRPVRLVFRHQPLWGDPAPFRELLASFARAHPGIEVEAQPIPNASDLAHQILLTALEGRSPEPDVFVLDVIWVAEFARAGWLDDLSGRFPPERLAAEFLPGPVQAVVRDGRTRAVPWFVDVGLLYYRTDLVPRAPRTYRELREFAEAARARDPSLAGYLWQGRQYEGLSCNVFEAVWGHGGEAYAGGRMRLDTAPARAALGWLRGLVASGLSPPSVAVAGEEETRRVFQAGRAVFLRNWPYAHALFEAPDSPVRGRVGTAALPSEDGEPGPGVLGGWELGVNPFAAPERRAAARELLAHLTSPEASLMLALHYARLPARREPYADPRFRQGAPFLAGLGPLVERARPRPLTPYYALLADALQGELSAAVSGLRTPAAALRRAQAQADQILGLDPVGARP